MRRVGIDIALRAAHKAAVYEDGERLGRPFSIAQTKDGVDDLVRRATVGTTAPVEFGSFGTDRPGVAAARGGVSAAWTPDLRSEAAEDACTS